VQEASSVVEARDRLAAESFELALCDINMAGESGLALVRQIAAELPDTGVVMVTGVDDPQVADEAMALGAYGYLVKPFLPNEVLINVDSGLRRRASERARRSYEEELESKVLSRSTALRQALKRLEETKTGAQLAERETVDRLVTALTLRSEETGGHIERMSRYAATLAAKRGIDAWTDDEFRVAAMLHDVGKIGVPDAILLKPGPLTEDEFAAIRRHPDLGVSLLGDGGSRVLVLGARIALTHHERWDGAGYPQGLKAEEIPLPARIFAVVDALDAMTHERPYRPARSLEEALEALKKEAGRQFDPRVVEAALATPAERWTELLNPG
jgi:putative two-component system response regulator